MIELQQKPLLGTLISPSHYLTKLGNGLKALFVFNNGVWDATGNCGVGGLIANATYKPGEPDVASPTDRLQQRWLGRGSHLYLDGTGDYVDIPNEQCQAINFGVKDFTIFTRFFSVDPTPNDEIRIFSFGGDKRYELMVATLRKIEFVVDDDVTKTELRQFPIYKQWHEIVVQREYGIFLRIRRNLIDAGWNSVADNTGDITTTDDFQFGTNKAYGTSPNFAGYIDFAAFYEGLVPLELHDRVFREIYSLFQKPYKQFWFTAAAADIGYLANKIKQRSHEPLLRR